MKSSLPVVLPRFYGDPETSSSHISPIKLIPILPGTGEFAKEPVEAFAGWGGGGPGLSSDSQEQRHHGSTWQNPVHCVVQQF